MCREVMEVGCTLFTPVSANVEGVIGFEVSARVADGILLLLLSASNMDKNEPASEPICEESTAFWLIILDITACVVTGVST